MFLNCVLPLIVTFTLSRSHITFVQRPLVLLWNAKKCLNFTVSGVETIPSFDVTHYANKVPAACMFRAHCRLIGVRSLSKSGFLYSTKSQNEMTKSNDETKSKSIFGTERNK